MNQRVNKQHQQQIIVVLKAHTDAPRDLLQKESEKLHKGPVKLMQQVKITHSFLQSVSNLSHFIILSLPM